MSGTTDKTTNWTEEVKSLLASAVEDIDTAPRGELTLYSPSKNIRVFVTSAKSVAKSTYESFLTNVTKLSPAIAIFVSAVAEIPRNYLIHDSTLVFYFTFDDLDDRFLDYIQELPEVEVDDEPKVRKPARSTPSSHSSSTEELPSKSRSANASHTPSASSTSSRSSSSKPSFIESYDETQEGFDNYCHDVPKSKIEFTKAKAKWPEQMKAYPKLADLTAYVVSLKEPKPPKEPKPAKTKEEKPEVEANGTEEEFNQYLIDTPASQLRKTYIKEHFGNLDDSITFLNETKDFQKKIREYQRTLKSGK